MSQESCSGVVECAGAELIVLIAAVFLISFLAAVVDLENVLSEVDTERARLETEADAFAEFAKTVAALEPSPPQGRVVEPDGGTLVGSHTGSNLDAVQEAYERTVMSVPHFESEYEETLATNMAAEFGDDVTGAVLMGSSLTPRLKGTLLERSRHAHDRRRTLLDHLEQERSAVAAANQTFKTVTESIERINDATLSRFSYDQLRAEWYLLKDRTDTCEAILRDRQQQIQDTRFTDETTEEEHSLQGYLYEPLSVSYPVLARGSELIDRLEHTQNRVARHLARLG